MSRSAEDFWGFWWIVPIFFVWLFCLLALAAEFIWDLVRGRVHRSYFDEEEHY